MKRASETVAENSQRPSSSSGVVKQRNVPLGETMDVKDANASLGEIGRQDVSSLQSSREFEFGEHKVQMSAEEANLVELAPIQVRDASRHHGCDVSERMS